LESVVILPVPWGNQAVPVYFWSRFFSGLFDEESVTVIRFFLKINQLLVFLVSDSPGFKACIEKFSF